MRFADYKEFNTDFSAHYEFLRNEYPYAFMVLEKDLRHLHLGRSWVVEQNASILKKRTIKKRLYRIYFVFFRFIFRPRAETVYFAAPKFSHLKFRLKQELSEFEMLSGSYKQSAFGHKSLRLDYLNIGAVVCRSRSFRRVYSYLYEGDVVSMQSDKRSLKELDSSVKEEVLFLAKLFEKWRVKFIISDIDSTPQMRVIREAARVAEARFIVIAHGYVQDKYLVSIAPIYADKLFVWTPGQKQLLDSCLRDTSSYGKVFYSGVPHELMRSSGCNTISYSCQVNRLLMVLEPVSTLPDQDRLHFVKILELYLEKIQELGLDVTVRLHPKDDTNWLKPLLERFYLSVDSNADAIVSIRQSYAVIGSNSSMLIESVLSGIPAFQMLELKKSEFEFVKKITFADILNLKDLVGDFRAEIDEGRNPICMINAAQLDF